MVVPFYLLPDRKPNIHLPKHNEQSKFRQSLRLICDNYTFNSKAGLTNKRMQCNSVCFECTSQEEILSYEACGPRDLKSNMSAAAVFLGTENSFTLHGVVGCFIN
jgi:hypothetical protein